MSNEKKSYQQANKAGYILPDAFYDILTYVTPSVFLITGVLLSIENTLILDSI